MKLDVEKQKWILLVISFLCGYFFIEQLCDIGMLQKSESMFIITVIGCLVVSGCYLYWRTYQWNLWVLLFSFVVTCVGIIGFLLRTSGGDGVFEYYTWNIFACGVTGFSAVSYLVTRIYEKLFTQKEETVDYGLFKKYYWSYFVILFVAWIPGFLAYYPGIFAYDVHIQITMVKNAEYTTHHPLIHTLMLKFFYLLGEKLGSYTTGVAIYTIVQMVICALVLAYVLWYLYTKRVKRILRIAILLFFAIWPINSLLAISATKDTLFSVFVLLFAVLVLRFLEEEKFRQSIPKCCMLAASGILVFLFRNNAKYALAVWAVVFIGFLFINKLEKYGMRMGIAVVIAIFAIGQLSNMVMIKAVDAKPGSINEMMSMPISQIARCYAFCSSEMTPEMVAEIDALGISTGDYVLSTVDIAKGRIQIEGQEKHFLNVWWKLFKQFSGVSIDASLYINQGNIFLDDVSHAYVYGTNPEERKGYLITSVAKGYGVEHYSLFPWLENIFEDLFTLNTCQEIPFLATLFAPAFYFWMLAVCVLHALLSKNWKVVTVSMLLLAYYGTILLGPCSLVRYMYPLIVSAPVLLAVELQHPCKIKKKNVEQ
ncbi:MAG: hypothetical protein J6A94_09190 [Lachnospiraceae bacterium]|nr:hypothetical protein [Lachnospiraceae bacterium]